MGIIGEGTEWDVGGGGEDKDERIRGMGRREGYIT